MRIWHYMCNVCIIYCYRRFVNRYRSITMQPAIRQLPAVLLSALITYLIYSRSFMFLVPWWAFVLTLGVIFLVADYGLQMLYQRINTAKP